MYQKIANLLLLYYHYNFGENLLEYADSEKDLGVDITSNLSCNEHCDMIISRAKQKSGMLRRTCNFVNDVKRKRILCLTLIESQFEHCSQIWHPNNLTMIDKFENGQKNALNGFYLKKRCLIKVRCKSVLYIQECKHKTSKRSSNEQNICFK